MRSILWGVHLLGHAVKEVPTFVKSMPQPSHVISEQFSCRMLETPCWKGAFRIDYPDLGAPHVEVVKFQDLV